MNRSIKDILVDRDGFDGYASNVIRNLIENDQIKDGFRLEDDTLTVFVTDIGKEYSITIKDHTKYGWKTFDLTLKKQYCIPIIEHKPILKPM